MLIAANKNKFEKNLFIKPLLVNILPAQNFQLIKIIL